jgi:hypothetical protein
MKFRLFRRRLTISAPRMAVRSHLPWPLRWVLVAVMLGLCGAVGLWAFEFGRSIAGLDGHAKEELTQLRGEVKDLREERDKALSVGNTSQSLLTAEKAAQDKLAVQLRLLEAENRTLKDDLGFFERLLPTSASPDAVAIRGLQVEPVGGTQLKWQVLVIQPLKNAPEFNGKLELNFAGQQSGKAWSAALPGGAQKLQFKQYRRLEGVIELPPQAVVKTVSAKVMDGSAVRATQTIKL